MSATFDISDLSPYVDDYFEDLLDLRINPLEEAEVDTKQGIQLSSLNPNDVHGTNEDKEDQGKQAMINQVHSLFLYSNPELNLTLDGLILVVSKMHYRRVLLCRVPKMFSFTRKTQFRLSYRNIQENSILD